MRTATCKIHSLSPYSQSRMHQVERADKETWDDHEKRTWRNKAHTTEDGRIFMPPTAFTLGIAEAAKFNPRSIPGRGKSTYTKHFRSGVMVTDGPVLDIKLSDVDGEWINANSDGVRGSGKRVQRCFPTMPKWAAEVVFYVLDDTITEEVFEATMTEFGAFIGVGRFRPANGGYYGRFEVDSVSWSNGA